VRGLLEVGAEVGGQPLQIVRDRYREQVAATSAKKTQLFTKRLELAGPKLGFTAVQNVRQ
jgi:hypothetical protein